MAREFYEGGAFTRPTNLQDLFNSMLDDTPTPYELVAHHEAGHAVAAVALNFAFKYVSIIPDQSNWGGVVFDGTRPDLHPDFNHGDPDHRRRVEDFIIVVLAGEASEALLSGREFDAHRPDARGDWQIAYEAACRLYVDPKERDVFLEEMKRRVLHFMQERRREKQISSVSLNLRLFRVLYYDQVRIFMDEMSATGVS